jgi:soluble lytic murein transglycosylase-like protein
VPLQPLQLEYERAGEIAARVLVANGCSDRYAPQIGRAAVDNGINPQISAGIVFVESSCNTLAVIPAGAVGLMQVNRHVWRHSLRELRDPETNTKIGTKIFADYVHSYGLRDGLHRFNGLGENSDVYSTRVLVAAYRR